MTVIWLEKQAGDIRKHVRHWDDDDFEDDYISHSDMIRELFDDDDDLFDDDDEQELDWNDGWHEFDDNDFEDEEIDDYDDDIDALLYMLSNIDSEDDEPEDDSDDFSMDGKHKFRIIRRPRGTMGNKDFINYLDLIRYLYDEEGD